MGGALKVTCLRGKVGEFKGANYIFLFKDMLWKRSPYLGQEAASWTARSVDLGTRERFLPLSWLC